MRLQRRPHLRPGLFPRRAVLGLLVLALSAVGPRTASAGPVADGLEAAVWPMLGGSPRHAATSSFLGPGTSTLAWTFGSNAAVDGGVAVDSDGSIYFGTANGRLYALEQNGVERWSQKSLTPIIGVPVLGRDGRVYVAVTGSSLYAFDRRTGAGGRLFHTQSPVVASPAIAPDGTIVLATRNGGVYGVSPAGALRWQAAIGKIEASAPAIDEDGIVYVGTADGRLVALAPDGQVLWDRAIARKTTIVGTPSIGLEGRIYAGAEDGGLRALDGAGNLAWTFPAGRALRGGIAIADDGTLLFGSDDGVVRRLQDQGTGALLLWAAVIGAPVRSTPVVDRAGAVYVGADDKHVRALEPGNGAVRWTFRTGAPVRSALALGVGGRLLVGSDDRTLYAIGEFRGGKECWDHAFIDAVGLPPEEANRRFQALVAACGGPDVDSCRARVLGTVNADRTAAAFAMASKTIDPSTYLAYIRALTARLATLRAGTTDGFCEVAAHDRDGDLVPDRLDACSDTPFLTPTLANGCPDPARPDAGNPDLVYEYLAAAGMLFDPHCSNREPAVPVPGRIEAFGPGAIFQKHILFVGDNRLEPDCGAFYEVEILHRAADGSLRTFYIVGPRTFGNRGCAIGSVTPGLRMFCMAADDPGPQGEFARLVVPLGRVDASSGIVGYRMRATSYDGRRSPWSSFVVPGEELCLPGQCPP